VRDADIDRGRCLKVGGQAMASAEREPITGVWGQSPQRGPGAEPLVGSQGSPPEAESFFSILHTKRSQNLKIEMK